jgi:hypothetical protein
MVQVYGLKVIFLGSMKKMAYKYERFAFILNVFFLCLLICGWNG